MRYLKEFSAMSLCVRVCECVCVCTDVFVPVCIYVHACTCVEDETIHSKYFGEQ